MASRSVILDRLSAVRREAEPPEPWQSRRAFPDLAEQFSQAVAAALGEAHVVPDLRAALDAVVQIVEVLGPGSLVRNPDCPLDARALRDRLPEWAIDDLSKCEPGSCRDRCAQAVVGVSGADAGLAETGTVVVKTGPGLSRLATLLPPIHIAVLSEMQLVSDLFAWAAERQEQLPANVVFISGPSKSADIAQTLTVGVHGPARFVVIVYKNEQSLP